jgi:hypothetical protein
MSRVGDPANLRVLVGETDAGPYHTDNVVFKEALTS